MYELNMEKIKNLIDNHNDGLKDFKLNEITSICFYLEEEEIRVYFSYYLYGANWNNGWQNLTFEELGLNYEH